MSGYGKIFDSLFTGSMFGSGPVVISVWAYVISKTYRSKVELNPPFLAAMIGCEVAEVEAALAILTSPDPSSRSKEEEGRRLLHEDGFMYHVVNHSKYRDMVALEQNRERVARHRAAKAEEEPKKAPAAKKKVEKKAAYTPAFEEWWGRTWQRGHKASAFATWEKMEPEEQIGAEEVVDSWAKAFELRDASKRPHVSTWLNNRGWEDVVDAEYGVGKGAVDKAIESKYSKFD